MSAKAKKAKGKQIRDWHLNRRIGTDLSGLARAINAQVRGWINYYGAFYRSELYSVAVRIDEHLVRWAMRKFKRLRGTASAGMGPVACGTAAQSPALRPLASSRSHSQPTCKSRMS